MTKFLKVKCINFVVFMILILAVMEVMARIDDKLSYDAHFLKKYNYDMMWEKDNEGIQHYIPNSRFEKWQINRFGFRGNDFKLKKGNGQKRIICMGASETFGLYESPNKEWPAQLNTFVKNNMGNKVEVINASVAGITLKHLKRYIEKYVIKFDPDIIILYFTDLTYALERMKLSRKTSASNNKNNKILLFKEFVSHDLLGNLRILPKVKQVIKENISTHLLRRYQLWDVKRKVKAKEFTYLHGNRPKDMVSQKSVEAFHSDVVDLVVFLKKQKIKIILSTYPILLCEENIERYPEIFLDIRRFLPELSFQGIIDTHSRFNDVLSDVANKHGIYLVDNSRSLSNDKRYFMDLAHYSDKGASLVASNFEKVVMRLFQKKFVPFPSIKSTVPKQ